MSNKEQLNENNERLLAISEKLLKIAAGGPDPVLWEKGVNINDLGTGYFYLDAKLEEGDWEVMGLPEKYGPGWQGVYLVIKGMPEYGYEAYLRDWYDDTLWYTFLEGWSDTIWNQIITDAQMNVTSDVPMHLSINEKGGLRITYNDGN